MIFGGRILADENKALLFSAAKDLTVENKLIFGACDVDRRK
jgi:hypothetical protein